MWQPSSCLYFGHFVVLNATLHMYTIHLWTGDLVSLVNGPLNVGGILALNYKESKCFAHHHFRFKEVQSE